MLPSLRLLVPTSTLSCSHTPRHIYMVAPGEQMKLTKPAPCGKCSALALVYDDPTRSAVAIHYDKDEVLSPRFFHSFTFHFVHPPSHPSSLNPSYPLIHLNRLPFCCPPAHERMPGTLILYWGIRIAWTTRAQRRMHSPAN